MGNFFSSWYDKTVGGTGDAGQFLDPVGALYKNKDNQDDEEERRRKAEAQAAMLKGQLDGKIRDVLNLHSTALPTSGDLKGAARRDLATQRARKGRESTILTGDILGGGS